MIFKVSLSETAVRQLKRLPAETRRRVVKAIRRLEENPFKPRPGVDILPIRGTEPKKHRLRVGDYRAVFMVTGAEVKVIEIFSRGREYR